MHSTMSHFHRFRCHHYYFPGGCRFCKEGNSSTAAGTGGGSSSSGSSSSSSGSSSSWHLPKARVKSFKSSLRSFLWPLIIFADAYYGCYANCVDTSKTKRFHRKHLTGMHGLVPLLLQPAAAAGCRRCPTIYIWIFSICEIWLTDHL